MNRLLEHLRLSRMGRVPHRPLVSYGIDHERHLLEARDQWRAELRVGATFTLTAQEQLQSRTDPDVPGWLLQGIAHELYGDIRAELDQAWPLLAEAQAGDRHALDELGQLLARVARMTRP